ncbi:MAG TPA: alpha/beta hydrolase [Bosea sp. (in: a-proteobacteria)]|jgi:acetyl esterase/lipase|uniref:alpha/beta hydrolase n=1 Tax=Bosea sp. (in: a-proteobacteria) TaxID=1871050 RepID=UPI002E113BD1|nr:alpha/beta hydrolase [Bosea sp. (in: a-proteobacteria)]
MLAAPIQPYRSPRPVFWRQETIAAGAGSLAARLYAPAEIAADAGLVLHLHGGAFTGGSLMEGEAVATMLAEAGSVVLSLDYPLAPAHRFPEALEAAYGALAAIGKGRSRWAAKHAPLYVAGEEAGGNIAAALALMARDRRGPTLAGQILLSPMLDPCVGTCSLRAADAGPVGCRWADGWADYLGTPDKAAHPYAAPINASRLAGLPPALLFSADDDPMRDEVASYATRLRDAGVTVRHYVRPGASRWPAAYADAPENGSCLCLACDHVTEFYALTAPS